MILRYACLVVFSSMVRVVQAQIPALPPTPQRPVTTTYFNTQLADPYRWLEDPARLDTQEWFQVQSHFTKEELGILMGRGLLLRRLQELTEEKKPYVISDIQRVGKRLFFRKRSGEDKYYKLWFRDGLSGVDKLLVDPAKGRYSAIAPPTITGFAPSADGKYVAYEQTSVTGDPSIQVLEMKTGKPLADMLDRARLDPTAWMPDGKSLIYTKLTKVAARTSGDEPPFNQVFLHKIGTKPTQDKLIFGSAYSATVRFDQALQAHAGLLSPGAPWVAVYVKAAQDRNAAVFIAPVTSLTQKAVPWKQVASQEDQVITVFARNNTLYAFSTLEAPAGRILRTSLTKPEWRLATPVFTPDAPTVLESLSLAVDAFYAIGRDGSASQLWKIPLPSGTQKLTDPKAEPVPLTVGCAIGAIATEPNRSDLLLTLNSWIATPLVYRLFDDELEETDLQPAGDFDIADHLAVAEFKVPSYDGTPIPMTVIYRRGLKLDGQHPALLRTYGAYGVSLRPQYDPAILAWLEKGAILAIAHVRGGGEYGPAWHEAGRGAAKANSWQDLIACAQHLITKKYTNSEKLAAIGSGAGALVVGGAVMDKPEFFRAVLLDHPLADMVRHDTLALNPVDISEFGSLQSEAGFRTRLTMSLYHRVTEWTRYPAVLLNAAPAEEKAVDWQAGKLAARMQAAMRGRKPVLLRIDAPATTAQAKQRTLELMADQYAFLFWQMGNEAFQPLEFSRRQRAKKPERVMAGSRK